MLSTAGLLLLTVVSVVLAATAPPPLTPAAFFFNDTATTEIYTLSLHDALPISPASASLRVQALAAQLQPVPVSDTSINRSEEHTSALTSHLNVVCPLLFETDSV